MRTNLSRFTVSFSDLAWESVLPHAEIPIFPRADEVGLYLATYAERYLPAHVLRLGHRVVRAVREGDGGDVRWTVHWAKERWVFTLLCSNLVLRTQAVNQIHKMAKQIPKLLIYSSLHPGSLPAPIYPRF